MNKTLNKIKLEIYDPCGLIISNNKIESEGKEYYACQFDLNGVHLISRNAKITPKKVGQFVACWKRNQNGITSPYSENDIFDFYVINVSKEKRLGQFVFPKSVLIDKGIVKTNLKVGKRGFRVYPVWDTANNKQAQKSQQWQLDYFYEVKEITDLIRVKALYKACFDS
jgi:hypothetical protein